MEVNSSPGLEGIERATKLDVAGAIIDFIDNQVAFPEIDVRQRLTVSHRVRRRRDRSCRPAPTWSASTLGESGLRERDITVLTLQRGTERDPQPQAGATCSRPATGCCASASSRRCAR